MGSGNGVYAWALAAISLLSFRPDIGLLCLKLASPPLHVFFRLGSAAFSYALEDWLGAVEHPFAEAHRLFIRHEIRIYFAESLAYRAPFGWFPKSALRSWPVLTGRPLWFFMRDCARA